MLFLTRYGEEREREYSGSREGAKAAPVSCTPHSFLGVEYGGSGEGAKVAPDNSIPHSYFWCLLLRREWRGWEDGSGQFDSLFMF